MSALRARAQEVTAEYWEVRESQSERVAVAQLILALARVELELQAAATSSGDDPRRTPKSPSKPSRSAGKSD